MKVDKRGSCVPRAILILIAGIVAGINSIHAASVSDSNNGDVGVKQIKYSTDDRVQEGIEAGCDKNQSSPSIGLPTTEVSILPRGLEPRSARYANSPVRRGSTYTCSRCGVRSHQHYGQGGGRKGSRSGGGSPRHFGSRKPLHIWGGSRHRGQGRPHYDEHTDEHYDGHDDDMSTDQEANDDTESHEPNSDDEDDFDKNHKGSLNHIGSNEYHGGWNDDFDPFPDDDLNGDMSYDTGTYSMNFGDEISPSMRKRLVVDSSNKKGYMLPNDVINSVQELAHDPLHVTFVCQPRVGKYLCKIHCGKRDDTMTGTCESGYCTCILKADKKMRKKMNKRFLAGMYGFKHDCVRDSKHCKRFCKALTKDKSFTGVCKDNFCKCVTYPKNPDKKKTACKKAIRKLKKMENTALSILGVPPVETGPPDNKANAAADKIMNHLKTSQNIEDCTPEDLEDLRRIISNLTQRLKYAKKSGAKNSSNSSSRSPAATFIGSSWEDDHAGTQTPNNVAHGPGGSDSPDSDPWGDYFDPREDVQRPFGSDYY